MAAGQIDEYNMLLMLNRDLEGAIKEVLLDDIVKQQLKEFEDKIRPMIKAEVGKMSFRAIDKLQGMMEFRNDLRLYVQWSDEEKQDLLYKIRETVTVEQVDK